MGLHDILSRFNKLHKLIEDEATGTPEQLSKELGVSKRQLLNYLTALKHESKEAIVYDRITQNYKYDGNAEKGEGNGSP